MDRAVAAHTGQSWQAAIRKRWPWLKPLFADGACDSGKLMSASAYHDFVLGIVRKLPDQIDFQVLPRRSVMERIFGWLTRWLWLMRDDEKHLDVSRP